MLLDRYTISSLITAEGTSTGANLMFYLRRAEIHSRGVFTNFSWDDKEVEEATGNKGATMERW